MRTPVEQALAFRGVVRDLYDVRQLCAAEMVQLISSATPMSGWRVFEEEEDSAGEIRLRRVLLGQFLRVKQELIHEGDRGAAPVAFLSVAEYISAADKPVAIFADGDWRWVGREYFEQYSRFV